MSDVLVKIPYELYREIKHRPDVEKVNPFMEALKEEIEYAMDAQDILDDEKRATIMEKALLEFEDYGELTSDIYYYISCLED